MIISKNITNYLHKNNWNLICDSDTMLHYTKIKDDNIYHLYISYFVSQNEYQIELGVGDTQDNSQLFKLRNIVSVLKRRDL